MIILVIASVLLWTGGQSCQFSDTFDPCSSGNHEPFPYMSDRCPDCSSSSDRSDLYDLNHDTWYITEFNMTTKYVSPYGCGTRVSIWMNGTIPKTGEGVVSRRACIATFESWCAVVYSIKVKRCGSATTVYCLDNLPSSIQQRYCFDFDQSNLMSTKALMTPITATSKTTSMTIFLTTSSSKSSSPPLLSTVAMGKTDRLSSISTTVSKTQYTIRSRTTLTARSLTTSSTISTRKPSSRLPVSTKAMGEAYISRHEENGIQIWVIAVIAGLIVAIITLVTVIIAMKRRFHKKKDDNEYDVPEKKYASDAQTHDYMTLDLPPPPYKEAISTISDQSEIQYESIHDICK